MPAKRARLFEYSVATDQSWAAHSDRGGLALPREEAWTPEHLLLAALARCTLTSLEHHARRAGIEVTATTKAQGTVRRREEDDRFAFVSTSLAVDVALEPALEPEGLQTLLARAERDCFVGASLTARPTYVWTVQGEEVR